MNRFRKMIAFVLLLTIVFSMSTTVALAKTTKIYTVEGNDNVLGHSTKFSVRTGIFGNKMTVTNTSGAPVFVYVRRIGASSGEGKTLSVGDTTTFKLSGCKKDYNITMSLNYKKDIKNGIKSKVKITV